MIDIELKLNGIIADIQTPLGLRLNRQLLNPAELNTKDAQCSYSISLPATAVNNRALGHANVEEVRGKFTKSVAAELHINGAPIFLGRFRLSEVTRDGYKGNLYVPSIRSVKDIFGDLAMNANPPMRIPFAEFAASVTHYNKAAALGVQKVIFPLVLYGVLPKVPLDKDQNNYSPREVWDASVRVGLQDFPPSLNILYTLRHIFEGEGYKLSGTAFDDDRLARLYMSYQNEEDYVQPWNYGAHGKIHIQGLWSNERNIRTGANSFEAGVYQNSSEAGRVYACDMLSATNTKIEVVSDPGANVISKIVRDDKTRDWLQTQIRVPTAGLYKVELTGGVSVNGSLGKRSTDHNTGVQIVPGRSAGADNAMSKRIYELRLLRDWGKGDFGLDSARINGVFYRDNMPQNNVEGETVFVPSFTTDLQPNRSTQVLFIDPAQDRNHLLGFGFGKHETRKEFANPRDLGGTWASVQAAKPGLSWDSTYNDEAPTKLAIFAPGYQRHGGIEPGNDEGTGYLAYGSEAAAEYRVINRALTNYGDLAGTAVGRLVLYRFPLNLYSSYVVSTGVASFAEKIFITGNPLLWSGSREISAGRGGEFKFSTTEYAEYSDQIYMTMYLRVPGIMDVDGRLTIYQSSPSGSGDMVGWTMSDKFRTLLLGAPENYAHRGEYLWQSTPLDWTGQGSANAVVWLNAGELLTVAAVSQEGRYLNGNMSSTYGWVKQEATFDLKLTPYRSDEDWYKVAPDGKGKAQMDWSDTVTFDTDSIDLIKFLPKGVKTNDFVDNVVKAFNLKLTQSGASSFSLDVKQTRSSSLGEIIDFDDFASVRSRTNTPLGLPSRYNVGFTTNPDEEGFMRTGDDGGGSFETGADDGEPVEQKCSFSFGWFKDIKQGAATLPLPIISKADVWGENMPYNKAMAKRYTSLAARFWYFDGLLNDVGGSFAFNSTPMSVAKVSNSLGTRCNLSYKNAAKTLLRNYFTLLIGGASHYTTIEGYLSPQHYDRIGKGAKARFNGDLYFIAEVNKYDPEGRNKTEIKLIRAI